MHVILFVVGIVLALTGAFLVYSSVPVVDVAPAALFNSGIIALVGGLIMMALAAVVRSVGRIAERLEMQPLPLPPVAAVGRDDPAPRAARGGPAAARRPSLLSSWFGGARQPADGPAKAPAAPADVPAAPPVDLAPLARVPEEPRVAMPPPIVVAPKPAAPPLRPPPKPPAPQPPAAATAETTVYKSGVIDGMAYTLFMDGSIEADLPQGRVRFASIDDLQKYLTTRG